VNFGVGHGLGLPHMDIQFMFGKVKTFCPLFLTHPPFHFCCYTHVWDIYVGAKGAYPQQLWDDLGC
jgi:hypothetical protein